MRKGFTLVELLAVIVILAIILAIAIPGISNVINSTREASYQNQEKLMINAAKTYLTLNFNDLPTNIDETKEIQLSSLQSNNYIGTIKDLKDTSVSCDGYVLVRKISTSSYSYVPYLDCGDNYVSKTIVSDGLVLDMPLGDYKSSDTFLDKSGNGNNGVNYGSVFSNNRLNEINKATSFPAVNDYIDIANSSSLNITDKITVSCWVKMHALTGYYKNLVVKGNSGNQYYWFWLRDTNMLTASIKTGGANYDNSAVITIPLNTWMNVAFTYDQHYIRLYKDGVMVGTPYPLTGAIDATTTSLKLSFLQEWWGETLAWDFDGELDDVRIYNRALSDDEILHNYNIDNQRSL